MIFFVAVGKYSGPDWTSDSIFWAKLGTERRRLTEILGFDLWLNFLRINL